MGGRTEGGRQARDEGRGEVRGAALSEGARDDGGCEKSMRGNLLLAEMMKAGLIEEMVGEALDSALDTEDQEEETEEQIDQILAEIAGETRAALPSAKVGCVGWKTFRVQCCMIHLGATLSLAQNGKITSQKQSESEEIEEADMEDMRARLEKIKA